MSLGKVGRFNERIGRGSFVVFEQIMSSTEHPHHPQPRVTSLNCKTNVDQNVDHCGAWLVAATVHPTRDLRLSSNVEG